MAPDDEGSADDGGEHLRGEPRALRPNHAEERDGERDRDCGCGRAHRDNDTVRAEPVRAAADGEHVDEGAGERQRHRGGHERDGRDAHGEQALRGDRRRENEIEISAGVEGARDRFHRLRHHQEPRQQDGGGDADQKMLVDDGGGEAADHEPGDHVHADDESRDAKRDAAAARRLTGGHHRQEIAPGEPRFVAREPDGGAGLDHGLTLFLPRKAGEGDHASAWWRGQACSARADTYPDRRALLATSPVNGGGKSR
jgi:hypothetical protein